jgi:hypothetical protein
MDYFFGADGDVEVYGIAHVNAGESGGEDTEDFEGVVIEGDALAEDAGTTSVFFLPEAVAEDGGTGAASLVVGGAEGTAETRTET